MRLRVLAAIVSAIVIALSAVVLDAARRRGADHDAGERRARLAASIGLTDLALSSGARWLRHPSQAEPAAAISEVPGALDVDPAGAWIGPPRAVLAGGARATLEVR